MRILMISDNLMKGGKERRMLELLRFFDTIKDIEILLIILKDQIDYPKVYELKNTKLHILTRKIKKDPFVFFRIFRLSKKFGPDIFHSWGSMPSVYIFLVALFMRKPLINAMIANAICKKFSKNWIRAKLTFPFSKIILANSRSGLEAFNVTKKKGRVIFNGFNLDRLLNLNTKNEIRAKYSLNKKFTIGMVAAFHDRKDYETYLEVADKMCESREDLTFLAIGDGKLLDFYRNKYAHNKNIHFTGNILDIEALINAIDIGVLLTNPRIHFEGISNALLEFMALGKPTIASRGGGTDELIKHNDNGLLIKPLSTEEFEKTLNELIKNSELRLKLGQNAREDINKRFSIESMAMQTIGLYKELVSQTDN